MTDSKPKILFIEDDRMISDVYKIALENAGYDVATAMDGEEGLSKITTFFPDLILLDIFLPKKSGFDIIEELNADSVMSKIPVIVLTNIYVDREDMIRKGVKKCLIKAEITPGLLVEKVKEILAIPVAS